MKQSESIVKLAAALVAAQAELPNIPRNHVNPFFDSNYADLTDIAKACQPILAKHKLAISQGSHDSERNGEHGIAVVTRLLHESGEWLESTLFMPCDMKNPQAAGSALTYGRRYGWAIIGVCSESDDDANVAAESQQKPAPQGPTEEAPKGYCPVHKVPFVHRVGVSKPKKEGEEGKPYDFWACPQKVGKGFCKQKPLKEATPEEQSVLDSEPPTDTPSDSDTALNDELTRLGATTGAQMNLWVGKAARGIGLEEVPANWASFPPDKLGEAIKWLSAQPTPSGQRATDE